MNKALVLIMVARMLANLFTGMTVVAAGSFLYQGSLESAGTFVIIAGCGFIASWILGFVERFTTT